MFPLATINLQIPSIDPWAILPVLVFAALMAVTLCLELRDEVALDDPRAVITARPAVQSLAVIVLVGLIGYFLSWEGPTELLTFNDMLYNDVLSRGAGLLITICALLAVLSGPDELEQHKRSLNGGEYCALIFAASLGMILMVSTASTLIMFLGLELFSLALYLLCIFYPNMKESRESGMKYFLLSSAASAILLYGLALLYGATGTTWLTEMSQVASGGSSGLAIAGVCLVACGLLFKLAVAPLHFWAPDVYEGAPTTVTAFMSVATKVAALGALWRLSQSVGEVSSEVLTLIIFSLSIVSILLGNFLALSQTKVKRMLAYSGVANAGYLLMALVSGPLMLKPMLFFLATYTFGNVGAFIALSQIEQKIGLNPDRKQLNGLFHRSPWLGATFALCLWSVAGLPPVAGFIGKFYLFGSAIAGNQLILPVIGIIGSLIGAAYYIGTAISLFAKDGDSNKLLPNEDVASTSQVALAICCAGIVALGLFPGVFL